MHASRRHCPFLREFPKTQAICAVTDPPPPKFRPHARRKARRALVQAIYQWQMNDVGLETLRAEFHDGRALDKADHDFFDDVLAMVIRRSDSLDAAFRELLDRDIQALNQVELAIIRLGVCELLDRPDVPYRVVIDEYVELAKIFGAEQSYKYINGVLDKLAATVRVAEPSG